MSVVDETRIKTVYEEILEEKGDVEVLETVT